MQRLTTLLLVLVFLSGCQSSPSSPPSEPPPITALDLSTICVAYSEYCSSHQKPPSNLDELRPAVLAAQQHESGRKEFDTLSRLEEGRYLVMWDQVTAEEMKSDKARSLLLACEASAKTTGGWGVFVGSRKEWLKPEDLARLMKPQK